MTNLQLLLQQTFQYFSDKMKVALKLCRKTGTNIVPSIFGTTIIISDNTFLILEKENKNVARYIFFNLILIFMQYT